MLDELIIFLFRSIENFSAKSQILSIVHFQGLAVFYHIPAYNIVQSNIQLRMCQCFSQLRTVS